MPNTTANTTANSTPAPTTRRQPVSTTDPPIPDYPATPALSMQATLTHTIRSLRIASARWTVLSAQPEQRLTAQTRAKHIQRRIRSWQAEQRQIFGPDGLGSQDYWPHHPMKHSIWASARELEDRATRDRVEAWTGLGGEKAMETKMEGVDEAGMVGLEASVGLLSIDGAEE